MIHSQILTRSTAMNQKNLMKTIYFVSLLTFGAVWPWASASAAGLYYVNLYFSTQASPTTYCFATFNCPSCSGTKGVTLGPLTCYKVSDPINTTCTATCGTSCGANYDSNAQKLTSSVTYVGCGCTSGSAPGIKTGSSSPTVRTGYAGCSASSGPFPGVNGNGTGTGQSLISSDSDVSPQPPP